MAAASTHEQTFHSLCDCRYAEMDAALKSSISHRAVALGKLCDYLRDNAADVHAAAAGGGATTQEA